MERLTNFLHHYALLCCLSGNSDWLQRFLAQRSANEVFITVYRCGKLYVEKKSLFYRNTESEKLGEAEDC